MYFPRCPDSSRTSDDTKENATRRPCGRLGCRPSSRSTLGCFNSTSQDSGPNNNEGWQAYSEDHEDKQDSDGWQTANYSTSFGDVGVTPAWPNTDDINVQQSIDRGAGNDGNWADTDLNLVTDWLGIDTRTGNGGNGNWDGVDGTPTYMTLTLSGLAADSYNWRSYHHDTENVHVSFAAWVSTDGGANFTQLADGYMADSTEGGNPDSTMNGSPGLVTDFAGLAAAGGIYDATFTADGANDVVLQFAPYSGALGDEVHNQLWGINGFQLAPVPEPATNGLLSIALIGLLLARRRR